MTADYNNDPYPTRAQPQLHVENLFVTARLKGLQPVPVERARVLEVGCGDGMNLIPMACRLPEGTYVGVDYARAPAEAARQIASDLGLSNFRCHHADIAELADDFGEFDYIIAHGFYSWVPDAVREHLWRVASGSLSARGLLFVSYNLLPGWRQTAMLRDFVQLEKQRLEHHQDWRQEAWRHLRELASLQDSRHPLAIEAARTVAKGLETAIHDEFEAATRPFLFREVLEAAAVAGFCYAGDAVRKARSGLHVAPAVAAFLDTACEGQPLLREQYLDVMTMRPFRQSVFARTTHQPAQQSFAERVAPLHFTVAVAASKPAATGGSNQAGAAGVHRYLPLAGTDLEPEFGFESDDRLLPVLAAMLLAKAPERLPVSDTLRAVKQQANPPVTEEEGQGFEALFEDLVMAGVFPLSASPLSLPSDAELSGESRPRVGALNRLEAAQGRNISSREHKSVALRDPLHRALILLLDGQRTVAEVAAMLSEMLQKELAGDAATVLADAVSLSLRESTAFRQLPGKMHADAIGGWMENLVRNEVRRLRSLAILEAP